jgi:hypothetical protein
MAPDPLEPRTLRGAAGRRNGADNGHDAGTVAARTRDNRGDSERSTDTESSAHPPRRRWRPPTDAPRRLLTLPEAAAYLSLSPWSVRDLQWKGRLPRVALSRKLLFDRADLDRLIDASKERP